MPPTPQQSLHSSIEEREWQAETEVTVIAKMESCLDKSDELRVEFMELEHLVGPEDPEVNLMFILTKASRRGSSILEIFSTSGSDHFVASRNCWVTCQEQRIAQQERVQRRARKDGDKDDLCWTEASERLARRMLKYLEDSECTKVGRRELEEQVLLPYEPGDE